LSFADPVVWKDAFAHRHGHPELAKSTRITIPPPNGVNGMLFATQKNHSRYLRAFAASFSDRHMQRQQPLINNYVDLFIDGLKERSMEVSQDMATWFIWTTFDIIGTLTFGESFGCLEYQRTHPWITASFGEVMGANLISSLGRV
jgi:cytochrome P450